MDSIWALSNSIMGRLPRVVLDHELLVELERHLVAGRQRGHAAGELVGLDAHPVWLLGAGEGLLDGLEVLRLAAGRAHLDAVALAHVERGDVSAPAIDEEVAMAHQLAGLRPAARETHAVDDVVETGLEQPEEVLTGHAGARLGRLEVALEGALVDHVDAPHLLLL